MSESIFKHPLGVEVVSNISGFKGIITSRAEHLNGCNRYWVQPKVDKEGKPKDGIWMDEEELVITSEKKVARGRTDRGGFPRSVK